MKTNHLIAIGMALIAISYGLGRYTYGLFVPDFREKLGLSTTEIGTVASVGHLGYIVSIVLCIVLIRIFSPRVMILLGGLSAGAGLLLLGAAESGLILAVAVFIASMSAGLIWTATPDAVSQIQTQREEQDRVLSWANSGTSVGVLAATPVALFLATWQGAFLVYGVLSLGVTLWAWRVLPPMQTNDTSQQFRLKLNWFICPSTGPLLLMAAAMGVVAAIYWTFAVDLIVQAGMTDDWIRQLFWFASGAAGISGLVVARMIQQYGLRRVIPVNMIVLTVALGLLALIPDQLIAVLVSAVCFGVGFISVTGLLAIWSVHVFDDRPSAGIGAVLILVAVGQVISPAIAGFLAEQIGLVPVFAGGAVIALLSMSLRPDPGEDIETTPQAHSAA